MGPRRVNAAANRPNQPKTLAIREGRPNKRRRMLASPDATTMRPRSWRIIPVWRTAAEGVADKNQPTVHAKAIPIVASPIGQASLNTANNTRQWTVSITVIRWANAARFQLPNTTNEHRPATTRLEGTTGASALFVVS